VADLRIWKYHGTGNDFIMVEDLDDARPLSAPLVTTLCDRRFGVGADGVIRVVRAERGSGASFFMDHWNADGTTAEMCGNGIRCLSKLVREHGHTDEDRFDVLTRAGVKRLSLDTHDGVVRAVTVGMGPARLSKRDIPMLGEDLDAPFVAQPFDVAGRSFTATAVSMGNPHLVLFVDQHPNDIDVHTLGPAVENDPRFPNKTNVEFVRVVDDVVHVRVWERGVGETLACGTGACAALVAAHEAGLVPARATVRFPGGELVVERGEDQVYLTGPAERVFDAVLDEAWLGARGLA
jgi:diaminopimelate epimerase